MAQAWQARTRDPDPAESFVSKNGSNDTRNGYDMAHKEVDTQVVRRCPARWCTHLHHHHSSSGETEVQWRLERVHAEQCTICSCSQLLFLLLSNLLPATGNRNF